MELLAAAGGLAACLQLADYGIRFASGLYAFAENAAAAGEELERFANRLQLFSTTTKLARTTLAQHCSAYPKSPAVVFMDRAGIISDVGKESTTLLRRLRRTKRTLKAMDSSWALVTSIKWFLKKSSIMELLPEMDGLQANLSLLMVIANYEALKERESTATSTAELASLAEESASMKLMIKTLVKTVERLTQQMERLNRTTQREESDSRYSARTHPPWRPQSPALVELGLSMYRHGVAPPPPPPKSSTTPGETLRRRVRRPNPLGVHENANFTSVAQPSPSPVDDQVPAPHSASSTNEGTLPSPSTSSSAVSSPPTTPGSDPPEPQQLPVRQAPPQPGEKKLRLDPTHFSGGRTGYILSSEAAWERHATAVIQKGLEANVISMMEAARLGLTVEEPGGMYLDDGPGTKTVGKTTFLWTKSSGHPKCFLPVQVECVVLESCQPGLIFGQPFLDEVWRLWPRREQPLGYEDGTV